MRTDLSAWRHLCVSDGVKAVVVSHEVGEAGVLLGDDLQHRPTPVSANNKTLF